MKKQETANTSLKENRTHGTVQYPVALYEKSVGAREAMKYLLKGPYRRGTNGTEKMSGMWFRIGMRKWNGSIFKKAISRYG